MIAIKERELAQTEDNPIRRRAASLEEIAELRIDLGRLKAEAAMATGDYSGALKLRDAVVLALAAIAALARVRVERKTALRSDLRTAEVALAEAKVESLRTAVRKQLADIVAAREQELREANTLFDAKAISAEELRKAEQALSQAKLRLAESR